MKTEGGEETINVAVFVLPLPSPPLLSASVLLSLIPIVRLPKPLPSLRSKMALA